MSTIDQNRLILDPDDCFFVGHAEKGPVSIFLDSGAVFLPLFTSREKAIDYLDKECEFCPDAVLYRIIHFQKVIDELRAEGAVICIDPTRKENGTWEICELTHYETFTTPKDVGQA